MSTAILMVEGINGESVQNTYGHKFHSVDDAKSYLGANRGGFIRLLSHEEAERDGILVRLKDEAVDYYLLDGDEIEAEPLANGNYIEVADMNADANRSALEAVMTAAEAVQKYEMSETAVRKYIRENQDALLWSGEVRKSGGTWLILRRAAERIWAGGCH